ncbi:MAG: hypothetical protein FJ100_06320 [Deltaproteobacteria bacterium]|nr:hypothetical protein [Deltaproteobacteria bacterium]
MVGRRHLAAILGCSATLLTACSDPVAPPAASSDSSGSETAAVASLDASSPDSTEAGEVALAVADAMDAAAAETVPEVVPDTGPEAKPDTDQDVGDAADAVADAAQPSATDASADGDASPADAVSCKPASTSCEGAKLKTCLAKGDGYAISPCFPGTTCLGGQCVAVANNLIIAFDTSGSMNDTVKVNGQPKCAAGYTTWPTCEYDDVKFPGGCTRMGASKHVFKQALAKIDDSIVHMALFRFPQKANNTTNPSCSSGYHTGASTISGDAGDEHISEANPAWYWNGLSEILCVPFATNAAVAVKDAMLLWMDGKEDKNNPPNPELRQTGGTPIGKTLFYVGEYVKNKVVIDGKPCTSDASCANVNYICKAGGCVDPSRSCRETVVVLFTDGGEGNSNSFFSPWVQAKRLASGLGCNLDADCAGGAACQEVKTCKKPSGQTDLCTADLECAPGAKCTGVTMCMPKDVVTGYFCSNGMAPCLPDAQSGTPTFCNGVCVKDPRPALTASAKQMQNNVLRSFDGKPLSVRVIVVDISGVTTPTQVAGSASIAIAGNGKLLGADASDPNALLASLDAAFDIKTKKVCGVEK